MLKAFIKETNQPVKPERRPDESWLELVRDRVHSIPFGEVQIVIHDSKVVQVAVTEKKRFDGNSAR